MAMELPYNYEAIIGDEDSVIDNSSMEKLYDQLYSGVYLKQGKQKYWVDKDTGANCFEIYPQDLSFDETDWKFYLDSTDALEVAELTGRYDFHVVGKLDTENLTPKTSYRIQFHLQIKTDACGLEAPVELKLELPNENPFPNSTDLSTVPKDAWRYIQVRDFDSKSGMTGEMKITMSKARDCCWKKGLVVKAIKIAPKK